MEKSSFENCPVAVCRTTSAKYTAGEYYLVRIVLAGRGAAVNGKAVFLLRPGSGLLICPNENVRIEMLSEADFLDFYCNAETASLMQTLSFPFSAGCMLHLSREGLEQIQSSGDGISAEQRQKKNGYQLSVMEKFLGMTKVLFRDGGVPAGQENGIAASLLFMADNYSRDITLHDLAGLSGMSVSHYRRSFQRLLGVAPIECLLGYRLIQAEKRLCGTSLSIAEIAEETGFDDPNYFSRVFSRRKGMSPREWRQANRKISG